MIFIAQTDNKKYQIEVQENSLQWKVILTELKTQKTETHLLNKTDYQQFGEVISFIFKNKSYLVDIINQENNYTIFTKGSHRNIQILTKEQMLYNELSGLESQNEQCQIKSGMPGKVVEIYVKQEDTVKEGDLLLIIEAMKMENEIRAGMAGKIKKIYVKKNQNVETQSLLLSIKNK